ncbi:MAG: guanylate kinase [Patescibacteria group bacterium]
MKAAADRAIVITGPSGAGKNTLISAVRERIPELAYAVSATTRPPRKGERDGVDYHFLSPDEFAERVERGDFVEHESFSGYHYGTLRSEIEGKLAKGTSVMLDLEVKGARNLHRNLPGAYCVFVQPPSVEVLKSRLKKRGTESAEQFRRRTDTALIELKAKDEFDATVVNDRLGDAVDELTGLVRGALKSAG